MVGVLYVVAAGRKVAVRALSVRWRRSSPAVSRDTLFFPLMPKVDRSITSDTFAKWYQGTVFGSVFWSLKNE
jgi:hypothetical protein